MTAIFGSNQAAKLFLPKGSASWNIKDVVKKDQYANVFLLSFSLRDRELVDVRRCFDETTHIFAFGRNPAQCVLQVSVLMFLYNGCTEAAATKNWARLDDIRKAYAKQRVYKSTKALEVTIDGFTCNGFLIDMSIDNVNPSDKTSVVTFTFLLDQEV
jgi:hypothetical protein